ncbi:MAG: cytochrome P450 [Sandaracinaceae bacterium]|nr:cytochrome P450 [Sandaracinaceae bacterium]
MNLMDYLSARFRRAKDGLREAPLVPGDPLTGHLLRFREDAIGTLEDVASRGGEVVRAPFGPFLTFVISDPEHVQTVLVDRHRDFPKFQIGQRALEQILGGGLLTTDGPRWMRYRRTTQPSFHKRTIDSFDRDFVAAAEHVFHDGLEDVRIDVHEAMMKTALHAVSTTLLSADIAGKEAIVAESLDFILHITRERTLRPSLPRFIPTREHREFLEALERLDEIVYRIIAESRLAQEPSGLVASLSAAEDPETGEKLTTTELRDQLITLFLAGHETTASALSFSIHHLVSHPEIYQEMLEEIDGVLGDRVPTSEDLPKLDLTRRVIEEAMRLHPPAWMMSREVRKDTRLGEYFIPRGSVVIIPPYLMHRNPRFWDEPLRFDPSRFLPEARRSRPRYAYFPFGGGPRLCIGLGFALAEATLVLARVSQRYRFERPAHAEPLRLRTQITLRPESGMTMILRRRGEALEATESVREDGVASPE